MLILLLLIALAARVDAAPGGDPIDLAVRYANALTGAELDAERALGLDGRAARAVRGDEDDEDDEDDRDNEGGDEADLGRPDDGELTPAEHAEPGLANDAELALGGDPELSLAEDPAEAEPGALAMLDAEMDPGDTTAGLDASVAASTAGAAEVYEQWMRHRRPSPWGRLDVGLAWRCRWSEPMHAPANRYNEIWLVATWRR